ncbi:1-phosphatidylinositol 4-5-bisphosphate phosphodiesterase 1 [Apiospora arundinis]
MDWGFSAEENQFRADPLLALDLVPLVAVLAFPSSLMIQGPYITTATSTPLDLGQSDSKWLLRLRPTGGGHYRRNSEQVRQNESETPH